MEQLFLQQLQLAYAAVSIAGLCVAVYTDLKARVVPNTLVFGVAGFGLLLKALESFLSASFSPLFLSLEGVAIAFAACYILYRMGVWAGGDVKLIAALAVLNPVNYRALGGIAGWSVGLQGQAFGGLPVFGVSLIIYSALAVLPLGLAMTFSAVFRHREVLGKVKAELVRQGLRVGGAAVLYSGASFLLARIGAYAVAWMPNAVVPAVAIIIVFAAAYLPGRIRQLVVLAAGIAGLAVAQAGFVVYCFWVAVPLLFAYALWITYSESRKYAFRETVRTEDLEEGMVPDKAIVEKKGVIILEEPPSVRSVINQFRNNRREWPPHERPAGERVIFSPNEAGGLSKEGARELRELAGKGKVPKEMRVRKTMAFVPAVLAAYVALQFTGDLLWKILF